MGAPVAGAPTLPSVDLQHGAPSRSVLRCDTQPSRATEGFGDMVKVIVEEISVGIERHGGGRVPQHALDGLYVCAGAYRQARRGVSHVVRRDPSEGGVGAHCTLHGGSEPTVLRIRSDEVTMAIAEQWGFWLFAGHGLKDLRYQEFRERYRALYMSLGRSGLLRVWATPDLW